MCKFRCYILGLILSFNVFAADNLDTVKLNDTGYLSAIAQVNMSSTGGAGEGFSNIHDFQSSAEKKDELIAELSIYGLIILIYSLYWLKVSH